MCCRIALAIAIAASALVSVAQADVSELVDRPAPDIRARALEGEREIDLADYRGRVVVLAFFATWCRPCHRIAPELDALASAHRDEGLTILALSHEPRDRIRAREVPRSYPVLQCTGRTAVHYQATELPTLIVIDRAGVVRAAYQGASREVVRRLQRDVARFLATR